MTTRLDTGSSGSPHGFSALAACGAAGGAILGGIDAAWTLHCGFASGLDAGEIPQFFGISVVMAMGAGSLVGTLLALMAVVLRRLGLDWDTGRGLSFRGHDVLEPRFCVGLGLSAGFFLCYLAFRMKAVFPYLWQFAGVQGSGTVESLVDVALFATFGVLLPFALTRRRIPKPIWWLSWIVLMVCGGALIEAGLYETSRHGAVAHLHTIGCALYLAAAALGLFVLLQRRRGARTDQLRLAQMAFVVIALSMLALAPLALAAMGSHQLKATSYRRTALTYRILNWMPHFFITSRATTARQIREARASGACDEETNARVATEAKAEPSRESKHTGGVRGVVIVVLDTFRADRLGATRDGASLTASLERFGERAVTFERAYATTPKTWHALGASLTGRAPGLPDLPLERIGDLSIAKQLRKSGVTTAAATAHKYVHHLVADFDTVTLDAQKLHERTAGLTAHETTAAAIELLESFEDDERFVMLAHYFDPHAPHPLNPRFAFGNSLEERYDADIAYTDAWAGELLERIDRDFGKDTAVIVTSDHGEELWDHGYRYHSLRLYDESTKLMMMLRTPGTTTPEKSTRSVTTADLAPTVLDLLGLPNEHAMEGESLLESAEDPGGRPIFLMSARKSGVGIVDGSTKLIVHRPTGILEYYDLDHDPHEVHNLADRRPERVARLYCKVAAWMEAKGQPIDAAPFSIPEPSLK